MNNKLLIIVLLLILSGFSLENILALYSNYSNYSNVVNKSQISDDHVILKNKEIYPHPIAHTTSTHSNAIYGSPLL